ncbi:hypothetical protein HNY73_022741 [Argiope bruennichi]|uniref:Uncharacterized protein n=1 Tax=Argiope bruennichi TaxID=94029 RepID=A0A8T0E1L0_ARGBR|nr:hypothetical protein HNY73_022741 [Argiope bruennichi]
MPFPSRPLSTHPAGSSVAPTPQGRRFPPPTLPLGLPFSLPTRTVLSTPGSHPFPPAPLSLPCRRVDAPSDIPLCQGVLLLLLRISTAPVPSAPTIQTNTLQPPPSKRCLFVSAEVPPSDFP